MQREERMERKQAACQKQEQEQVEQEQEKGYQEHVWVEMQEDEEDDINCLGMFDDPDPLDLFVHEFPRSDVVDSEEDNATIKITLEGYKAENGQQLNSTGLTLWRAAPILCNYLVETSQSYIKNKSVLELGAGLGLCGILAAALGASTVYMTDGDTPSLERMRDNVTRNMSLTMKSSCPDESVVQCKQLRWGQDLNAFKRHCNLDKNDGSFDIVMGSDIIYTEDILEPLFETVDFLLKAKDCNDDGVFLLAYARRNVKIDDVFSTAAKFGFTWTAPVGAEGCYVFQRVDKGCVNS